MGDPLKREQFSCPCYGEWLVYSTAGAKVTYDPVSIDLWATFEQLVGDPPTRHVHVRCPAAFLGVGGQPASSEKSASYPYVLQRLLTLYANGSVASQEHPDSSLPNTKLIVATDALPTDWAFDFEKARQGLRLTHRDIRNTCRVDLIRFALGYSEEHGHGKAWTIDDLVRETPYRSFAYPEDLIRSVLQDLAQEGKLGWNGTHGKVRAHLVDKLRTLTEDWIKAFPSTVLEPIITVLREGGAPVGRGHTEQVSTSAVRPDRVFIIHGHDEAKRRELAELLEKEFGLNPVVMMDEPGQSRAFIEKFEALAHTCSAAIAILTPDNFVEDESGEHFQPRPNVLFELGWFIGVRGRRRVVLVVKEGTREPSDLYGVEQLRFQENVSEQLLKLKKEIEAWGVAKR